MKAQTKKELVLTGLQDTRSAILAETAALPAEKRNKVFIGIWSAKELLAHLAGWDFANLDAIKNVLAGKVPAFYAHHDRDWKTYNAMLVANYKRDAFDELVTLVKNSQRQLIEFAQTIPSEAFNKDFGVRFRGYKVTIQRLLEAELKDEMVHLEQLQVFRRSLEK
jgi:hypothetical protein